MNKNKLAEGVYWVGAVDWDVRDFHGYSTDRGTTYNAFLIVDEKITLVDTVKKPFKNDLLDEVRKYVNPEDIDYIVVNHVEPDHSGALPEIMELVQPEKLICSPMGEKALQAHYHNNSWPYEIVKSGDEVSLGKKTLSFLETRMLHWPDSMFSFLKEDGILFSSDAFGQHYASSQRFDDESDLGVVMHEATKYYANILYLFSPLIKKLLQTVEEANLDIKMIAPDHGVIWRQSFSEIVNTYKNWANGKAEKTALVIYETMWHSTEKMAKAVTRGIEEAGIPVTLINLKYCHHSDVMTHILNTKGIVLGCSTLNNGILPQMASFLMYMKGLKPIKKIGAAFGSFGWSGEAVGILNGFMEDLKFDIVEEGLRTKYIPKQEDLDEYYAMGKRVGEKIAKSSE